MNKRGWAIIRSIIIYKTQFNFYNLSKLPPLIAQVGVGLFIHLHSSWKWQLSDFLDKYHHTSKLFNKYWKTIWLLCARTSNTSHVPSFSTLFCAFILSSPWAFHRDKLFLQKHSNTVPPSFKSNYLSLTFKIPSFKSPH